MNFHGLIIIYYLEKLSLVWDQNEDMNLRDGIKKQVNKKELNSF